MFGAAHKKNNQKKMMGTFNAAFRVILLFVVRFSFLLFFFWDDMMIPSLKLRAILHLKNSDHATAPRGKDFFDHLPEIPSIFRGFCSKKLTWLAGKSLFFIGDISSFMVGIFH